ncbi:permease prefix domain 1-containing protein [Actinopolymorpha pittospori]
MTATLETEVRSSDGPIAAYLRCVERRLRAPRSTRRELTTELADGLFDAAEAYQRAGVPPVLAEARAVRECGPVDTVVAAYRPEVVALQGRRTAALFALSMPVLVLAWGLVWSTKAPGPLPSGRWHLGFLSGLTDWAGLVGGVAAMVAAWAFVISARRAWPVRPVVAGLVALCGASLLLSAGSSTVMEVVNGTEIRQITAGSWPVTALGFLTTALTAWQVVSLWRSAWQALRKDA